MKTFHIAALALAPVVSILVSSSAFALEGRDDSLRCNFQFVDQTMDSLMNIRQQMDTNGELRFQIQLINACTGQRETLEIRSVNVYSTGDVVINGYVEHADGSGDWRRIEVKQ
ncbi:hypothetical protein HNI00_17505 [Thermoleptolyngbya oregonensis NK1-22]|uniref:DUF3718 domain-containing protein n=1 Tax=Thermoleptolyngbya oregonensis NK1-22 TaxID=2547457 RepID=A0AA96Y4Q8_9CYAN|nr:hypothetical protein [Thermoleptolyngbya oregonensis]WOB44747.1 hypothetical protein HNI00_17505 [Thermoleptolyngbya oregonensis NK1-22]